MSEPARSAIDLEPVVRGLTSAIVFVLFLAAIAFLARNHDRPADPVAPPCSCDCSPRVPTPRTPHLPYLPGSVAPSGDLED